MESETNLFGYITVELFRKELECDFLEMQNCKRAEAWKAVTVLAGSIVEAVLVEHLSAVKYQKKDPLNMYFVDLISAARAERIISARTEQLCTVLRDYRNLIHAGRLVRLEETVTESSAIVASELVKIIVDEVTSNRAQRLGLTAKQIIDKLERDPKVVNIMPHLLTEVSDQELEHLLLRVLPNRLFELVSSIDHGSEQAQRWIQTFEECFRLAFKQVNRKIKAKVVNEFVDILKSADSSFIDLYETAFFKTRYLQFVTGPGRTVIIARLLNADDEAPPSGSNLNRLWGIEKYCSGSQIEELVDVLVRILLLPNPPQDQQFARIWLTSMRVSPKASVHTRLKRRLTWWTQQLRGVGEDQLADQFQEIMDGTWSEDH